VDAAVRSVREIRDTEARLFESLASRA
jgi:hypothetical protein